jgi:O-succinylbenzoic acid--CoA ligase
VRDWLGQRARASPEAAALVDARDGGAYSYDDLDERVELLAGRLAAEGIGVDDHVGLLASGVDAVAAVHATMRVGARLVPLSAALTAAELAPRIDRADLDALLCDAGTAERALAALDGEDGEGPESDPLVRGLGGARVEVGVETGSCRPLAATTPRPFELPEWALEDPLVMLYTSGTTGRPKLVVLTVKNLLASAAGSAFRLGVLPDDRWASPLTTSSMGGLAPIYRASLYGSAVVRCPTDPEALLAAMADHGATGVSLVPTLLSRLLDAGDLPDSLRTVLLGGAPAPEDLIERCADRGVPVCPTYGMTETASQVATARPGEAVEHVGTVGRPLLFTEVTVVDERGDPVATGESGELVVAGPTVTPGYYGDPELTTAAFDGRGLRTGDVGYRDEAGRLWVHNRLDDRIVTGGRNVDPGEVAAVLRDLPGVRDAAVVGLEDREWGQRVAALVEPRPDADGRDLDAATVEAHCRERLAGYKLPRVVAFDAIPRTASGTADREAVRERLRTARNAAGGD